MGRGENIFSVPQEILEAIISHLPLPDKVHFAATCHQLTELIYGSTVLWHEIDFAREFNDPPKHKEISNDIVKRVLNSLHKHVRSAVYQIDLSRSGTHSQINEEVIGLVLSLCPAIHTLALKDCPTIYVNNVAAHLGSLVRNGKHFPVFSKLLLQNDGHTASSIVAADLDNLESIHNFVKQLKHPDKLVSDLSALSKSPAPCDLELCSKCQRYFASYTKACTDCGFSTGPLCLVCQRFCDGCFTQYCSTCICSRCVSAVCRCTLRDNATMCYCFSCRDKQSCKKCRRMWCEDHLRRCTNCPSALCHARADSQDNIRDRIREEELRHCEPDGFMITCRRADCRSSLCLECAGPAGATNALTRKAGRIHGWLFCGPCKTGVCPTCRKDNVEGGEQWEHECALTLEDMLARGMLEFEFD